MIRRLNNHFWNWTTKTRPYWMKDLKEGAVAFTVFGMTGSASLLLVRPTVENVFGIKGSLWEGPNSYRVISIVCVSPVYAIILGVAGTLAGRHPFFSKMSYKILNRFIPKLLLEKMLCNPAKLKLKEYRGSS